jgi:putative transposase
MRLAPDHRHLILPVIGRLRAKENTRRLARLVAKGRARILSIILTEQAGGIDLGIGQELAVIAHDDGTIEGIAHPAPRAAVQQQRRRIARQLSRRVVGFRGHRQANAKLAALDRRAFNLRRESIHTLTTSPARRYGTDVIEDLDIAAMGRGMGRRAFRRSLYQAGLGRVRPTLAYKCAWGGGELVAADRGSGPSNPLVRRRHRGRHAHPGRAAPDRRQAGRDAPDRAGGILCLAAGRIAPAAF